MVFVSSCALTLFVLAKRVSSTPSIPKKLKFVPYSGTPMPNTLVVDCHHATATQLTHHLKSEKQRNSMDLSLRGDSTTDAVINALLKNHDCINSNSFVTCNHFDVDGFISCWCAMNPESAIQNAELMHQCGKIGDFRELSLESTIHRQALKLVCWLNSEEKRLFYRPFESAISSMDGEEDGDAKYNYFLPIFEDVIRSIDEPHVVDLYREEYSRVCAEYEMLHMTKKADGISHISSASDVSSIKPADVQANHCYTRHPDLGLVVVHCPEPLHYYSLFSCSHHCDIVVSIYSGARYEVETKYTTMVDIASRPVLPRVETQELAKRLNELETQYSKETANGATTSVNNNSEDKNEIKGENESRVWYGNRITDSGPLLRLEDARRHLTKVERYGHPFERPIYSSSIPSDVFESVVLSYFRHAYRGVLAKRDWTWSELHSFNTAIDWTAWVVPGVEDISVKEGGINSVNSASSVPSSNSLPPAVSTTSSAPHSPSPKPAAPVGSDVKLRQFSRKGDYQDLLTLVNSCNITPALDMADSNSRTALYLAAEKGHTDCVKLLLDQGASIDAVDKDGHTPLFAAGWHGHADCVKLLLDRGANVNTLDKNGISALWIASQQQHVNCVDLLVANGADVNVSFNGRTPSIFAE